jgi:Ser/Thr protein kinase RdoA (MazF antagonist)
MNAAQSPPFESLTPDRIMDCVESVGVRCDGRLSALNSFENRVYQVGVESEAPLIVKFYRPGRWSDAAIEEEHAFCAELAAAEIPVVAALAGTDGRTLRRAHGFRFSLYPRCSGRAPELEDEATLEWLGRFIARIHVVGSRKPFVHRPRVEPASYGDKPLATLLDGGFIPSTLADAYEAAARHALDRVRRRFAECRRVATLRLHADCHAGNILWADGPHFVDFDDCRSGPAVQDLWMLLAGERDAMTRQLHALADGYRVFRTFDRDELALIEPLRTLRLIHYAAWIAERWSDPAFPAAFPWFGTERYWQDQILALKEQMAAIDEAPLELA